MSRRTFKNPISRPPYNFKVLHQNSVAPYSGYLYNLPTKWTWGDWTPLEYELMVCYRGWHLVMPHTMNRWFSPMSGRRVFIAQGWGGGLMDHEKILFNTVRLLVELTPDMALSWMHLFSHHPENSPTYPYESHDPIYQLGLFLGQSSAIEASRTLEYCFESTLSEKELQVVRSARFYSLKEIEKEVDEQREAQSEHQVKYGQVGRLK